MKPLKKAEQHNAMINKDYYTANELRTMLNNKEIFFLGKKNGSWIQYESDYAESEELRIFISDMKEIKVVLNEYGFYTTVCINNDGKKYYITL